MFKHTHKKFNKMFMLIFLFSTMLILTSCGKYKTYKKMEHIYYNQIFTIGEKLSNGHYVFFYRSDCPYCKQAEPSVIAYGNKAVKNDDFSPIFVLNRDDKEHNAGLAKGDACNDDNSNTHLGKTSYEEIKLCSSPCLIYISDGKVTEAWDKSQDIIKALENALK